MKISEAIVPISYVKANAAKMIDEIVDSGNPVVITQNGRARVIIQDLKSYEQTQETIAMLKIAAQGERAIEKKRFKSGRKAFSDMRKKVYNRNSL